MFFTFTFMDQCLNRMLAYKFWIKSYPKNIIMNKSEIKIKCPTTFHTTIYRLLSTRNIKHKDKMSTRNVHHFKILSWSMEWRIDGFKANFPEFTRSNILIVCLSIPEVSSVILSLRTRLETNLEMGYAFGMNVLSLKTTFFPVYSNQVIHFFTTNDKKYDPWRHLIYRWI